ncbi:MAG: hypothetical protein HC908_14500, partial [Calothrix sp. SM1_7_51]|nr:hypothetical protein [Calothrix sp. SM1_7_51]
QVCTQALVTGWIVTASDGNRNWIYHSNSNGSTLLLANSNNISNQSVNLPRNVRAAVLRAASQQLKIRVTSVNIASAEKRTFKNGCLDLGEANEICSTALINGWRVVVNVENQVLVYHTNENGSVLKLNEKESQTTSSDKQFPVKTRNAILRAASRQLKEPLSIGNIMLVEKRTFSNGCLDLAKRNEVCTNALVEGWRVAIGVPDRTLVYHSNNNGSIIRLNEKESELGENSEPKLPQAVQNAVIRAASQRLQKRVTARDITNIDKRAWAGGCLELARPNEPCTRNIVPGWRVVVEKDNQNLVFHTNENGSAIRLNEKESKISNQELPTRVRTAVIRDAIQWSGIPASKLRIVKAEAKTWDNPCFLSFEAICNAALIPTRGWEVTVASSNQTWVYRTDEEAGTVSLDRTRGLEEVAASAIKRDAQRRSNVNTKLRIIDLKGLEDWNDTCKDVAQCTRPIARGYEATISNGRESWVYRVKRDGSQFLLSPIANLPLNTVPIPKNELPPALTGNIVFRQISSGGFIGRTYETVLFKDGRLMQYRLGDANDSERRVWQISMQQYNNFINLLMNSGFPQFRGLSFPAPNGAADYITYSLTTGDMTIQYNDISQENLPQNLRAVVNAWNQISKSYQ